MGTIHGTKHYYSSNIIDLWSQIIIANITVMKKFKILCELYHRDVKWVSAVGEMAPIDLFNAGLPEPSIGKKQNICEAQ